MVIIGNSLLGIVEWRKGASSGRVWPLWLCGGVRVEVAAGCSWIPAYLRRSSALFLVVDVARMVMALLLPAAVGTSAWRDRPMGVLVVVGLRRGGGGWSSWWWWWSSGRPRPTCS